MDCVLSAVTSKVHTSLQACLQALCTSRRECRRDCRRECPGRLIDASDVRGDQGPARMPWNTAGDGYGNGTAVSLRRGLHRLDEFTDPAAGIRIILCHRPDGGREHLQGCTVERQTAIPQLKGKADDEVLECHAAIVAGSVGRQEGRTGPRAYAVTKPNPGSLFALSRKIRYIRLASVSAHGYTEGVLRTDQGRPGPASGSSVSEHGETVQDRFPGCRGYRTAGKAAVAAGETATLFGV